MPILHPPGMILNAGWIEYTREISRTIARGRHRRCAKVIEAMDQERMALCRKFGLDASVSSISFIRQAQPTEEAYRSGSVYRALQESEPNRFIRAPENLSYRFLSEDIPFGIVPMAYLGRMLGIRHPDHRRSDQPGFTRSTGRTTGRQGGHWRRWGSRGWR